MSHLAILTLPYLLHLWPWNSSLIYDWTVTYCLRELARMARSRNKNFIVIVKVDGKN